MKCLIATSVLSSALLLSASMYAHGNDCAEAFKNFIHSVFEIESVDNEWLKAKAEADHIGGARGNSLRNGASHKTMNKAFFPLVDKMHALAMNLRESEVQRKLKLLEHESPIQRGKYVKRRAIVSPEQSNSRAPALIRNAAEGADFYQPREMSSHAEDFIFVRPDSEANKVLGKSFDLFTSVVTPISPIYGEKFAKDLLRTDQILMKLALDNLSPEARETFQKNSKLLKEEAGRVRLAHAENAVEELTPISSVSEGLHTFHQLVAELTMSQVPGAKNGTEALHGIVFEGASNIGLTTEITRLFPLAVVGPSAHSGRYFPDPLTRNADGKLEIAEHVRKALARFREKAEPYRKGRRVCPMAGLFGGKIPDPAKMSEQQTLDSKKAGLQLVAEAYWHIFELVSKQSDKL